MKFKGYTIISDLDGTLLDDNKKISNKDIQAIEYFIKEGGNFTIATGRAQSRVKMYHKILDVTLPAVFLNGTSIQDYYTGNEYWSNVLNNKIVELVKKIMGKYPHFGLEIYAHNTNYFINVNKYIKEHMKAEGFAQNFCIMDEVKLPWQKIFIGCDENALEILENEYGEYKEYFHYTKSDHSFYEILGKNINKGNAVTKLIEITNIDKEKIFAIGDNINDIEFLKRAKFSVAVKSACKEILEFADIIVSDNNNSPLYDLVNKIEEFVYAKQ